MKNTTEVVLLHCNIVNNDYQQDSRVLYEFVPNTSFGQLLDISPKNVIFLKAFDSVFRMQYSVQLRDRIFVKGYGFLSFAKINKIYK